MKIIGYSIKLEIVQHKINNGEGVSKGILFAFFYLFVLHFSAWSVAGQSFQKNPSLSFKLRPQQYDSMTKAM